MSNAQFRRLHILHIAHCTLLIAHLALVHGEGKGEGKGDGNQSECLEESSKLNPAFWTSATLRKGAVVFNAPFPSPRPSPPGGGRTFAVFGPCPGGLRLSAYMSAPAFGVRRACSRFSARAKAPASRTHSKRSALSWARRRISRFMEKALGFCGHDRGDLSA
jgi:hypothetical protein